MIILKILTGYVPEEGCPGEIYHWVAIDGDRCVVLHRYRHNTDRCDHERKEIVYEDQYSFTVQDNPHDLALPQEVIEALTNALHGKYDTSNMVRVELRRRPFTEAERERFEFQAKVAKAKAEQPPDADLQFLPEWAKADSKLE